MKQVAPKDLPPVSFIVPAYNEEKCLARTLISLLEVNYPKKEIIVVNDGSTDNTGEIAEGFSHRGVMVVNQPNRGKAAAINTGLIYATGEIIVTVDADSLIERNGLRSVIIRFEDPRVMAVCGNVKVLNRINVLTKCQALEYILDINLAKRAFDLFGSTMVVPGVFGAFRRQVLERGGRFDINTVTEDFDTTIKALKAGGVVQATSFAISYTEAPESLRDLYKQRLRWYRGTFQTLLKHRDVLNNPRFGLLSELGFPYILLSMIFVPWAGLGALISGLVAIFTGFWLEFLILLFLFIALETLLSLFSILLDEEDIRLLIYAPLFVIGYRQWRDAVKVKAMFDVFWRRRFEWGRAQRVGRAEEIVKRYEQK
jgi:cellulose synthase/poly-beta-1,6-N-acetylglucosamine synthase-like glycosyltransferase